MFIPNTDAHLLRKAARRDIHGHETYAAPQPIRCAVVNLSEGVVTSSVRADSAASRGAADETILAAKILLPPHVKTVLGDVIRVRGYLVEIASIQPRTDVLGKLDHFEIGGNIKGDM